MKQCKTVWLSLIVAGLLPFSALAADEEVALEMEEMKTDETNNRMLRQTTSVKGFQPLTVAGQEINAAYLEETLGLRHGAIVFLHDKGEQFESQGVVTPLRHALIEYGWSTLTLAFDYPHEPNILLSEVEESEAQQEMIAEPASEDNQGAVVADADAGKTSGEASTSLPLISNQDRIQAALAFLQAKEVKRVIFLAHGAGGNMAIELLDTIKTPISGLILVGAMALPQDEVFNQFGFPILDIYGENDLAAVPSAVQHRKVLMKRAANQQYQVRRIEGADHIFLGLEASLISTVSGWLRKQFIEPADK